MINYGNINIINYFMTHMKEKQAQKKTIFKPERVGMVTQSTSDDVSRYFVCLLQNDILQCSKHE